MILPVYWRECRKAVDDYRCRKDYNKFDAAIERDPIKICDSTHLYEVA